MFQLKLQEFEVIRKTVKNIFFVAALQKQKEHKKATSHKDVTILFVGTGVLDGPLAQDLICRKQIDNPDRFQCLSGSYLICSTNWNLLNSSHFFTYLLRKKIQQIPNDET